VGQPGKKSSGDPETQLEWREGRKKKRGAVHKPRRKGGGGKGGKRGKGGAGRGKEICPLWRGERNMTCPDVRGFYQGSGWRLEEKKACGKKQEPRGSLKSGKGEGQGDTFQVG